MKFYRVDYYFPVFILISLGLHLAILSYGAYVFRKELQEIVQKMLAEQNPKILVDLTDPRDDLHDPDKKVISRYNYAGKGKLAPLDGQHISGDFNPVTMPESTALEQKKSFPQIYKGEKEDSENLEHKSLMISPKDLSGKTSNKNSKNRKQKKSPASEKKRRLAIDTEDSLENKFWFDESQFLQISVSSHPDAEFNLELVDLLKKRFSTYILGGGALNFYQVKRDEATALASINSKGEVSFRKMILSSETQPYMNYLVSRVVDHPGIIGQLPAELMKKKSGDLYFLFNIRFTGEPLRKWWMGFQFLPENSPR